MENNELQKIWKNLDLETDQRTKAELNLLLASKTKQTLNKFSIIIGTSIIASTGLAVWLIVASLNRQDDFLYLVNNAILGTVTIVSVISGLFS